jgi:hypothetical protein
LKHIAHFIYKDEFVAWLDNNTLLHVKNGSIYTTFHEENVLSIELDRSLSLLKLEFANGSKSIQLTRFIQYDNTSTIQAKTILLNQYFECLGEFTDINSLIDKMASELRLSQIYAHQLANSNSREPLPINPEFHLDVQNRIYTRHRQHVCCSIEIHNISNVLVEQLVVIPLGVNARSSVTGPLGSNERISVHCVFDIAGKFKLVCRYKTDQWSSTTIYQDDFKKVTIIPGCLFFRQPVVIEWNRLVYLSHLLNLEKCEFGYCSAIGDLLISETLVASRSKDTLDWALEQINSSL